MNNTIASTFRGTAKATNWMLVKRGMHSLVCAACTLFAVSYASAQNTSGTWLGNGSAWNVSGAWSGGTIADGTGYTANFIGVDITGDVSMALGANRTIGNITFTDDTTSSHNLSLTGNILTLDVSSGAPSIDVTQSGRTLMISSIIAGNDGLTKNGVGTLRLSGDNTYTGGTVISAGTLQIGAGGTTGTLGTGAVTNNAALNFNRSGQITVGNVISGSGSVSNNGGTLEITGNNTYGGGTFVNAGTLLLRADTGGRIGSGAVTVAGTGGANYLIWAPGAVTLANNIVLNGATGNANRPALNHDGGAGKVTLSGTITLNATSDIGVGGNSANNMEITGVVSGVGGMIVHEKAQLGANYTLTLSGANIYTGPTSVTGGTLKAGVASVANVSGAFGKNSAVTLSNSAGVILDITGFNTQIGSLTGGGATGGNVLLGTVGSARTLTVGGDNTSPAAYAGVISQAGGVTKIGTGTQILSGTSTYTGQTTVSGGTLTFAGSSSGTLGAIQVGGTTTPVLNIQTGSYTQGAGGFFVGVGGGTGIVNHTGGTLTWNNNGLQLLIGNGGYSGTYNLSGGSVTTLTGTNTRGVMLGVNNNCTATFNLSGTGALTVAGTSRLMIGRSDTSQPNTTNLFSQTGGTSTISDMTMGGPSAAAGSANTATLTLTGGTFTATAFSLLSAAQNDVSTINIGGTAVVTLPNLPTARGTSSTATLNFDGGTLKNSATGTFITGLTSAYIKAGGAKFDTSLNSTTISQNLLTHGSSLGGGLTKIGTNTLTLSGTNTYTGATTVNAGTLSLGANNTIAASTNMVLAGGTLVMGSYSNSVGTLTVTANSTLVLGSGTLRFADSKSVNWTSGTLNISGTLGATSLRFGDSADDLTKGLGSQLAKISVNGSGLGTYILDANGYLVPPPDPTVILFF